MKKSIITKLGSTVMALAIILMSVGVLTIAPTVSVAGTQDFFDDFSSYISAPYYDIDTALPYDGTAKVVATHSSGAEWRLSTVYYGRNLTTPAYMWIEAANKRLILSSSQWYPQAINLDIKKEASTYEINKLSFDVVKNGDKSSGMSMFISSDEKTYYHIGLSGTRNTQYGVPLYTPFVAKVENGAFNEPVVLYYDSTQAWTASDVPAHFEVTVSGSTISWTVTGATSQTWSGTATDTYISGKTWQYPCAAFANSTWDRICAISNVALNYKEKTFVLLFEDGFDSYTVNYPLGTGVLNAKVGENWRTRATQYYGQAGIADDPTNTDNKILKINAYTNYILTYNTGVNFVHPFSISPSSVKQIQFDVYKDNDRVGAGIKFLMSDDESTGYALDFPGSQAGGRYSYRLYKMNSLVDDFTLLTEGESGDVDDRLPLYTWFTVKVSIDGDTISWVTKDRASGAVQSKWSGSYTSPTSLPENTGIQLFGENAKMDGCFVYFDNFKLYGEQQLYEDNGDGTLTININPSLYIDKMAAESTSISVIIAFYTSDNELISANINTVTDLTQPTSFIVNKDNTTGSYGKIFIWDDEVSKVKPLVRLTNIE